MTSDPQIRDLVRRIRILAQKTTDQIPEMSWMDSQWDPDDDLGPMLPFTVYAITGTAGAGKSTSISAIYQHTNCIVTGATVVASQNLSQKLNTFCPTIFNVFGFRGRHINLPLRRPTTCGTDSILQIQYRELSKYWNVIRDIQEDFLRNKGSKLTPVETEEEFEVLQAITPPSLWTSNIIVIDEAGTLPSHILMTVVYFYWFYNQHYNTPLYRRGVIPCIVCVGSPTQTDAYQSLFDHSTQENRVSECENILSFIISDGVVSKYLNLYNNWALFINNKRCLDPEFAHVLKTLEYNLEVKQDVQSYMDRLVVPKSKILNPLEYVGWTRLFLSHNEVKTYLASLHAALSMATPYEDSSAMLFTCPIVCEIYKKQFELYKEKVHLYELTPIEWLNKNLHRLSNYSQFIDQDMTANNAETTENSTRVTYLTQLVRNTFVSINGKPKKCTWGYTGTYDDFRGILESDTFVDRNTGDNPEYVYNFLNSILYNLMYLFHDRGVKEKNTIYLEQLHSVTVAQWGTASFEQSDFELEAQMAEEDFDVFYYLAPNPVMSRTACLTEIIEHHSKLKQTFMSRLSLANGLLGHTFGSTKFSAYTTNTVIENGIHYRPINDHIYGLLSFASSIESYKIKGYTHAPVGFGRRGAKDDATRELREKLPHLVLQDSMGFISCLENNINKMTEMIDDDTIHLCSAADYGVSSKLAMTIAKAQGLSLDRVAISFGHHHKIKKSHLYVAISRATDPKYLVIDRNPMNGTDYVQDSIKITGFIRRALKEPSTLLVY